MPANQRSGQINSSRLLREVWLNSGISRIELSQKLELDKSTVTLLVNRMLKAGILDTLSEGKSSPKGGRKPVSLGIRGDFGYFLGLEVLPEGFRVVLTDLQGVIITKKKISQDVGSLQEKLPRHIKSIWSKYNKTYPVLGVGLALSGIVDPYLGQVNQSMVFGVSETVNLKTILEELIPCEILVENDANSCAWGELVASREKDLSDFLFVLIESDFFYPSSTHQQRFSLGMGIAFEGKVYHGSQFSSGEFRSTQWQGKKESQFSLGIEDLSSIHTNKEIRDRLFHEISSNIAFLTNSLNLNHIFIGGDIIPFWLDFHGILQEEIQRNWSYPNRVSCSCNLSSHSEYAAAYGAAVMHLERVFAANFASFFQEHGQKIGMDVLNG